MYQIVGDRTVTNNADEIDSSSQISSTGQVGAIDNSSGATETNTDQDSQIDETTEQSTDPSTLPTPSLKGGEISDETYEALLASDYIELVRVFSEVSYNEAENITTVRTDMDDIREIAFYKELLYSVERQQYYYTSKGFVCTRTTTTNVVK